MIPSYFHVTYVDETGSTNADVENAAERGAPHGYVLVAKRQTEGRGRFKRKWESPEGNLYMSVLLRPDCSTQEVAHYTFVTSLAVFETVVHFLPKDRDVKLKWPNDVLVGGKKICGILSETALTEGKVSRIVIGVGLNVQHYPENGLYPATSLKNEGGGGEIGTVVEKYLSAFDTWSGLLKDRGFGLIRDAWTERARRGQTVVKQAEGTEIQAFFVGLDDYGCAIMCLPDGSERVISAGDMIFRNSGAGGQNSGVRSHP